MNNSLLHLDSIIESTDKYNGKKVEDIVNGKKGGIFQMVKKGYQFDDEVLRLCKITKTIRDVRYDLVIVEHDKDRKNKVRDENQNENITLNTNDFVTENNNDFYAGEENFGF